MEDQFQPATAESNTPNIKDLFVRYVQFLPLFIISVALSLLVAYIYLRYATPIYSAAGVIDIQQGENFQGDQKFQELFSSNQGKNLQSEIEYMRSRRLMERVVHALQLNIAYYGVGNIKERNLYTGSPVKLEVLQLADSNATFTFDIVFNNKRTFTINQDKKEYALGEPFKNGYGSFKLLQVPGSTIGREYKISWLPTSSLASFFIGGLAIAPRSAGTGLLNIVLESTNPQLAADVINQLMVEYQKATIEDKNVTTKQSIDFVDGRIKKIQHELDSVTNRLLTYQQTNNLINFDAQTSSYLSNVEDADKQIATEKIQLEIIGSIAEYLSNRKNDYNTTPSTLGLQDLTLETLITGYNTQQLERKALVDGGVPSTNVRVQQLDAQIEKLRQSILESLRVIRANHENTIADLQRKYNTFQSKAQSLPEKQQNLADIKRQQESKLAVYDFLQEKREELAISLAATISDTKVLEEAHANPAPVKPNTKSIRLMAIMVGLVLPALFIFVLELLNDKVNSRADVEKGTNAVIMGEIGHSYRDDVLVVTSNNRSVVAEQFRIIRSNLQYILKNIEKPVLLITSSFSGEGKSFISINMGSVMALAGKRTIILEFDIRKPKILAELGIPKKPGFINYIMGKATLEELPVPVEGQKDLFVLPCGPVPPNPAELLLDERLVDLFAYLRNNFDVVIIDTAPVGIVSDAMALSKYANATLYVVRQGYTFKKQLAWVEEFYQQGKLPKVAVILNDVKQRLGYSNYGYGQYGYVESSNYFDDVEAPPTLLTTWFGWLDIKKWQKKKRRTKA